MNLSDEKLYQLCIQYGERARMWRQKFAGLLPEVARRRLYEKKGFGSIFEFAAKLAGMSEEQVSRVLHLEEKFEQTPVLKIMLENGEVSFNKLSRVASVATAENQDFWAQQVKILPQRALETLVRDAKALPQVDFDAQFVHVHTNLQQNFENANGETSGCTEGLKLDSEVVQKLLELQQKDIDINKLILGFLEKRELEIAQEKELFAEESEEAARNRILAKNKKPSRHIPQSIKNLLKQEYGEKCAVPACMKSSETIHHTRRFALSKNHNPYFLAPLCEEHHAIAHSIDVKFHEKRDPRK